MSQISEYLKYQIQLRETMLPQCSEKKNNKKQKQQTKRPPYHQKIPKKTQDSTYKLYLLPSEFPLTSYDHREKPTKFKALFQTLGKNNYFL